MIVLILPLVALGVVAGIVAAGRRQQRLRQRIEAAWGQPRARPRPMDAIAAYHHARVAATSTGALDDRTWGDLDLDAVFALLDRTESTLGQQALYHRLRTAPLGESPDAFEALVARMTVDGEARRRAQEALAALQDPAGYNLWWVAEPDVLDRRAWHAIYPIVGTIMLASAVTALVWPGALLVLIVGSVLNLAIRGIMAPRTGWLVGPFRQIAAVLRAAGSLSAAIGDEPNPIAAPLRADLPALRGLQSVVRWIGRDPLAAGEPLASLMEYLNLLFLLDVNAAYFGAEQLRRGGPALMRVIAAVGEVDAAISVASVRAGRGDWTRPRFVPPGSPARLADVRHPLVPEAVPNSIALGPPHGVLVTGSNMSGKTTFVRTVGVNAVLAQTINTCLATAYEAPVLRVRSCIGRSDDLVAGKSYYLAEVEAVLGLVQASADVDPHLFLFDELFRGTNAIERIAAAEAVLAELLASGPRAERHFVLAATHDGELVDLLSDIYIACHFGDDLGPEGLMFDHRLKPGATTTRNAIALLRLHGAPARLVDRALARAEVLDRQRKTVS